MNKDNCLKLKIGSYGRVLDLKGGERVFFPCQIKLSNARVIDVFTDGYITAHWVSNYNLNGDFRTELMRFDDNLVYDKKDFVARNKMRIANGLLPIE